MLGISSFVIAQYVFVTFISISFLYQDKTRDKTAEKVVMLSFELIESWSPGEPCAVVLFMLHSKEANFKEVN